MRRAGRRNARVAFGRSAEAQVRASLPYSWWRSDEYTVDGVSGKVASWVDRVTAGTGIRAVTANHALAQATSASQCAIPIVDATFANKVAAIFLAQYYVSSAAASAWKFLHDGTGRDVTLVYSLDSVTGTKYVIATSNNSTAAGWQITRVNAVVQAITFNAGATILGTITTTSDVVSTAYRLEDNYIEGASPEGNLYRSGVLEGSGNTSAAPNTGDPASTLYFGNRPAVTAPFVGKWVETIMHNRVLSASERANQRKYLSRYF